MLSEFHNKDTASGAECEANTRAPRQALTCVIGFIQVLSLHQEKREGGKKRWEGIKEKGQKVRQDGGGS